MKQVDGLDAKTAQKVDFYSRQFVDAMSPSNFLLTNPEVLRKTAETGGENLLKGLNNLLSDLEQRQGQAAHQDDRYGCLQTGREYRRLARQGGLSERTDPAHPVQPDNREGAEAAAADRPAVDQQVLHPRSAAAEQLGALGRLAGPYGVRDLLGEPGREARRKGLRGLHDGRLPRRRWMRSNGDRRARGQRDRLLPRRHAAGEHAGLHGGQEETTGSSPPRSSSP